MQTLHLRLIRSFSTQDKEVDSRFIGVTQAEKSRAVRAFLKAQMAHCRAKTTVRLIILCSENTVASFCHTLNKYTTNNKTFVIMHKTYQITRKSV